MLAKAKAACVIGDRAHLNELRNACELLGGGSWVSGLGLWEARRDWQYVVLLADKPVRIARRAPLLMLARDEAALQMVVEHACQQLSDVVCLWVKMLEPSADALVSEIVLADSTVMGHA